MGRIMLKNVICDGKPSDIIVEGDIIKSIAPSGSSVLCNGDQVEDCKGMTAMPGFINMHTHAGMSLMRGMQEDVSFRTWIDNIWKIESGINSDFVYWGTKVSCIEMIKTGTTTFNDQYWYSPAARKAAAEAGLRGIISYVVMDRGNAEESSRQKEQCERMYEESLSWKDGSIFEMAFHAIYSVSEEMMLWSAEFARRHGLTLHIHLSETEKEVNDCKALHKGLTPVEYLDRLGILSDNVIAAHTLWLSGNDVRILGERKVNCVHNINSNAKLASGYRFLYNELRDAGANLCIGTDGCASSNNLDMLEAMKTAALFQKAWRMDPAALPIDELVEMATLNGAKALRLPAGKLEAGRQADIVLVDTDNTFFLSPGSFLANFVYSAHSDCIDSVMRGGRFLMRHRRIEGEKEILKEAGKMAGQL